MDKAAFRRGYGEACMQGLAAPARAELKRKLALPWAKIPWGDSLRLHYQGMAQPAMAEALAGDTRAGNLFVMESLQLLLPQARFIHLLQDGRRSQRGPGFAAGLSAEDAAGRWLFSVTEGRRQA